ncbi:hypothetical protein OKW24_001561 [Peribacillus simplex]|uniref:tRNA-guanine transglycosylase DpdA n=1 Tax=Peribacillus simplex TaxID=1478 RepID=UPI0024E25D7A|nr:tRNA-guanine transglycosylase DpdA [Peribacillus simplex]MDF9759788.1 hypothetical protein [Peribacillus simplex]
MIKNILKTLIITSCTGEKRFKPENELIQDDFKTNETLSKREKELEEYQLNACDIYTGMQHLRLMEGIDLLRENYGNDIVDLSIISAGYGLISERKKIVPYEVTFNNMNSKEIKEWSDHLQIPNSASTEISKYDLIIFLLGDKYIRSLQLPIKGLKENQKLVFLASKTSKKFIPDSNPYYFLEVGQNDAKEFSYGLVGLKGFLFKLLSKEIVTHGKDFLNEIYNNPTVIMDTLNKYRVKDNSNQQLSLFNEKENDIQSSNKKMKDKKKKDTQLAQVNISIPKSQYAKNYGLHNLKFFMPENDDRVDPNFNFITEEHTKDRDPISDDVYAHEIYDKPNYDGVLISKINIDQTKTRKEQILNAGGLHKFLRLPNNIPLYGDCGAFSYIQKEKPPYDTDEILDYYEQMGFDIGTSIDHLIIGKIADNEEMREFRYQLTLKNANDFIEKHKEGNYTFIPSGIAQGWDVESYRNSFTELIKMGYRHISLGGLALAKSEEILEILHAISPIVPEYLEIHLLGAARLDYLDVFHKLGVTSFDSTAFLKKAWGGATGGNYFTQDKNKYAALRIPQADEKKNARVKELVNRGIDTIDGFIKLEQKSLGNVREFDLRKIDITSTVETILEYDSYFETLKDYKQKYKKEKAIRDKYISEKLNISEQELDRIEKDLLKILKEVNKKKEIIGMEEYLLGDVSFHSLTSRNETLFKDALDNVTLEHMNKLRIGEKEAIEVKNLPLLEATLKDFFVENFDRIYSTNKLRPLYHEVLTDKPWKSCSCSVCRNVGVEVIIFRGNNRNRRRGFHNTYVFYNQLKEIVKQKEGSFS